MDRYYYNWVDLDSHGMGKNVPVATANDNDALDVLDPATGKFMVMRVPYPMGFFAKSLDGRIDDPKTGYQQSRCFRRTRVPFKAGRTCRVSRLKRYPSRHPTPYPNY